MSCYNNATLSTGVAKHGHLASIIQLELERFELLPEGLHLVTFLLLLIVVGPYGWR